MGAADGDGECVGGVGGDFSGFRQQAAHHEGDLILVGRARADDGEFYLARGELVDLEPRARE